MADPRPCVADPQLPPQSPSRARLTAGSRHYEAATCSDRSSWVRFRIVRLVADDENALELSVAGYQFPEAEDPTKRYSWHVVTGQATSDGESWTFRYPALTCEESPRLSAWLRAVADATGNRRSPPGQPRIQFTEPNLTLEVVRSDQGDPLLKVDLDLEFRAPNRRTNHRAGSPSVLHLRLSPDQLRTAAAEWDDEVARYPDRSGGVS